MKNQKNELIKKKFHLSFSPKRIISIGNKRKSIANREFWYNLYYERSKRIHSILPRYFFASRKKNYLVQQTAYQKLTKNRFDKKRLTHLEAKSMLFIYFIRREYFFRVLDQFFMYCWYKYLLRINLNLETLQVYWFKGVFLRRNEEEA